MWFLKNNKCSRRNKAMKGWWGVDEKRHEYILNKVVRVCITEKIKFELWVMSLIGMSEFIEDFLITIFKRPIYKLIYGNIYVRVPFK